MVDGKKIKPGPPVKVWPRERSASGLTRPGDLYLPGDALPLPDVVEKDTDSVWALWSDMVDGEGAKKPVADKDFKETMPLDLDAMEPTQLMDLPDPDVDKERKR